MAFRLPIRDPSSLLRHGALLVFANLCGALCNAAFHMISGRLLSPPEYTALAAMLGIVLAASTPMGAIQNTLAHYTALFLQNGAPGRVLPFYRRFYRPFFLFACALAVLAVLFRAPLAALWPDASPALVALAFATLGFSLLMPVGYGLLQGRQSFVALAWIPQAWGSTRLLLAALLLAFVSRTALAALSAQAAGVAVTLLLLALAASNPAPSGSAPSGGAASCRASSSCPPLSYALLSFLALAAFAALANLDVALARHWFPTSPSTDLFAKAATIARTAIFLPQPLAVALFPKVASDGSLPAGSPLLLRRALLVSALLALVAAAVCWLFPALPWTILYGAVDPALAPDAFASLRAMALALTPLALAYPLLQFALAQRRFRTALPILLPALLYLLVLSWRHPGLLAIPHALLAASTLALLSLLLPTLPLLRGK